MTVEEMIERDQATDLSYVLRTENGRRFLWRLIAHCGVYQDCGSEDTERFMGRRSVGLFIMGILAEHDEDKVFEMMREAKAYRAETDLVASRQLPESSTQADSEYPPGLAKFIS